MVVEDADAQVEALVAQAQEHLKLDHAAEAFVAARKALALQPGNEPSQKLLSQLQSSRRLDGSIVATCKSFVQNWDVAVGKQLQGLIRGAQDEEQGVTCLKLFLGSSCTVATVAPVVDECVRDLLSSNQGAKKELIQRLNTTSTTAFEQVWSLGQGSTSRLLAVLLDRDKLWASHAEWRKALRDVFNLLVVKVATADSKFTETAINSIVVLISSAADQLKDMAGADMFTGLLGAMDIRLPESTRRAAMVATKLSLDVTGDAGQKHVVQFVTTKVSQGKADELIKAFSAASFVFPVIPETAVQLFLTDGFLQSVVPILQRNSEAGTAHNNALERAALELISAACRDNACRTAIMKNCLPWLSDLVDSHSSTEGGVLAAVILVKTHQVKQPGAPQDASRDIDHLSVILTQALLTSEQPNKTKDAIEGLSYLALQPKLKESLSENERFLQKLIELLQKKDEDNDVAYVYGALVTVQNLVTYRPQQSEEQKKMHQLKAYAESSRPQEDDPLDSDKHVEARGRRMIETELIPALLSRVQGMSTINLAIMSRILLALSQDKRNRARLAQQGSVKHLLQIYLHLKAQPASDETDNIIFDTAHSLARILISVNPNHLFSPTMPATTTIRPLTDLLNLADSAIPLLATFESLLALTNVASMDDPTARETLIRTSFAAIEEALLCDKTPVRRAAAELVCNLMASPSCVALFAEPGDGPAKRRLHLLLALADVEDLGTRSAAGGALAMIVGYEPGCEALLAQDRAVPLALGLCGEEGVGGEQLLHRGLVVLSALVEAPDPVGSRAVEKIKTEGGRSTVMAALKRTRNRELLEIGVEVLKKLT